MVIRLIYNFLPFQRVDKTISNFILKIEPHKNREFICSYNVGSDKQVNSVGHQCITSSTTRSTKKISHRKLRRCHTVQFSVQLISQRHCVARNIVQCDISCNGRKRSETSCRNGSTFCNNFKQPSASLRSYTSPLPNVNACAMFRASGTCLSCNALRDKLNEKLHSVTAPLRWLIFLLDNLL